MKLHEHARARMLERGASEAEILAIIIEGERFPAKFGRQGFRRNFQFDSTWRGRPYAMKQIEAVAIWESDDWLVITVIVKYF
ncbi:MAG TPA: DUF4258 domain-containing protein [Stellaceae bacterium]|nr:DUF4258 domain-containing protein [Stellaceae bacterium]HMD65896.1 DUF4258 domain-containing protein [Stellaceae bacterium]